MTDYGFESILAFAIAVPISLGIILGWIAYEPSYAEAERRVEPTSYTPATPKKQAPLLQGTNEETTVYCYNTKEDFTFFYGYEAYPNGDFIILVGGNGALGGFAGYDVVSYSKASEDYNYLCFSQSPFVYSPMVIQCETVLEKEGSSMADNVYSTDYAYYSGTSNKKVEPAVFSAKIGKYPIVIELAFDQLLPVVVGTYYYRKQGPENRMIVHGERLDDQRIELWARDPNFSETDTESFSLTISDDEISGNWYRRGKVQSVTGRKY